MSDREIEMLRHTFGAELDFSYDEFNNITAVVVGRRYREKETGRVFKVSAVDDAELTLYYEKDGYIAYRYIALDELRQKFDYFDHGDSISFIDPTVEESLCDCGGLETYGSMSPVYHSTWCKSRQGDVPKRE